MDMMNVGSKSARLLSRAINSELVPNPFRPFPLLSTMFGQWRLDATGQHQPLPPHLLRGTTSNLDGSASTSASLNTAPSVTDNNDSAGYDLVFPTLDDFQTWRDGQEESLMVEFVKVALLFVRWLQRLMCG